MAERIKMRAECILAEDFAVPPVPFPLTKGKVYEFLVDPDQPDWVTTVADDGEEHDFFASRFIKWVVV